MEKSVHDAKTLAVALGVRGVPLAGVNGDTLLAAYLLDASATRHDLDALARAHGVTTVLPRTEWLGTGRAARPPAEVPFDECARHLAAEAWASRMIARTQRSAMETAHVVGLHDDMELPLMRVLTAMEQTGVRIDAGTMKLLGQQTGAQIAALEREIHEMAGAAFNIGSPKQLAKILFEKLRMPVLRKTKTGPSTDADVLEELATLHPVPAKILEYRTLTKLMGTYIEALPALVNPRTGRLHTTFNQAVAATGRLSSSDPNLQNIPIRTDLGRRIREAFVADEGCRIVSADYSQIELRVLAHVSRDPAFLDAFRSGQDIHQRTAAEVFQMPLDAVTPDQRRIAKAINFGLVFGQTDFGLAQVLRIPRAQAKSYIESYFARYAGVRNYMERIVAEARAEGGVTTLLGRRRPVPELASSRVQERNYGERIARNTPIQGSAADILKLAMIKVAGGLSAWGQARLVLTVHDELVFEVEAPAVAGFAQWVKATMESAHRLDVPLVVDVGHGHNWGEAH
jgi:DNA polymerase-1